MKAFHTARFALKLTLGALCLLETCLVQAGQPITPVAVTDQLPPGTGPNTGFNYFIGSYPGIPMLNDNGQAAFSATLIGVGVNSTNDTAAFSGAPGALELVAREGSAAPVSGNRTYGESFYPLTINPEGKVFLGDGLSDGTLVFFLGLPGALGVLAQPGDVIPGAPGPIGELDVASASNDTAVPINGDGRAVFGARFLGDSYFSLLVGETGSLSIAAQPGMQAPGRPPGITFTAIYLQSASLRDQDRILFQANDTATDNVGFGIYTGLLGNLALVARSGDQAVGTDPGVFYDNQSGAPSTLSNSGTVAFGTYLTGLGVTQTNWNALWVGQVGSLQLIARGGMQAPGVEPGVTYGITPQLGVALTFSPVINSSAQIAFAQYLSTAEQGIWAGPSDNLRLVARQGETAPGLAPGETFDGKRHFPTEAVTFGSYFINDSGRIAFAAYIGTRAGNGDLAIYVGNPDGELVYVTRYGDNVDLGGGRIGTIAEYPLINGFNSKGQLLIHAQLLDGTDGIFIADTAVAVVTSATSATGAVGVPFSYQISATNNPTSFSASGLPPGLNFNSTTGVISGTPTTAGTSGATISATNSVGQGPVVTLTITVAPAPSPTPTPSPSPSASPSPSPSASPSPSPSASPSPSPSASPSPSPSASPSPTPFFPVQLANISTRLSVGTNDSVLIGGFIVQGTQGKAVIVRAIGPSLPLGGVLSDPILEIHDSTGAIIATNDNWQESANKQAIIDAGFAPSNDQESAILMTLNPGPYTAIVQGVAGTTGVALIEVYDLDRTVDSKLANTSTRGLVQTSDNVMIGGMIILGDTETDVLVRAIGPALTAFGVNGALEDPTLELHDKDGAIIASNDDWKETQQSAIEATGLAPSDDRESAILMTLNPGSYTAIVRGKDDTTGVALVEVYNITP